MIEHERQRSLRLAACWESEIENPVMQGRLNMAQIAIVCALQYGAHVLGLDWRPGHPRLANWLDVVARRPSVAATAQHLCKGCEAHVIDWFGGMKVLVSV